MLHYFYFYRQKKHTNMLLLGLRKYHFFEFLNVQLKLKFQYKLCYIKWGTRVIQQHTDSENVFPPPRSFIIKNIKYYAYLIFLPFQGLTYLNVSDDTSEYTILLIMLQQKEVKIKFQSLQIYHRFLLIWNMNLANKSFT